MLTPSAHPARWAVLETVRQLLRKPVDDGCVIFEPLSGKTQLLSPLSHFIIELLEARAGLSTEQIVQAVLAEDGEAPDAAEDADLIAPVLDALDQLTDALLIRDLATPTA